MTKTYSSIPTDLREYRFDDDTLLSIGRLMRACTDLEDALTVFITGVAVSAEGMTAVMLGKSPVSSRQRIAKLLVARRGEQKFKDILERFFGDDFSNVFRCRNAAAHGILLGQTDDGSIAFETNDPYEIDPVSFSTVITFKSTDFEMAATAARKMLDQLDLVMKLPALREKRRERPLHPHHKAQKKGNGRAK